jgi:hypothetical protein
LTLDDDSDFDHARRFVRDLLPGVMSDLGADGYGREWDCKDLPTTLDIMAATAFTFDAGANSFDAATGELKLNRKVKQLQASLRRQHESDTNDYGRAAVQTLAKGQESERRNSKT